MLDNWPLLFHCDGHSPEQSCLLSHILISQALVRKLGKRVCYIAQLVQGEV